MRRRSLLFTSAGPFNDGVVDSFAQFMFADNYAFARVDSIASDDESKRARVKGFGTNWDQLAVLEDCKCLKLWWPETDLNPRRQAFFRAAFFRPAARGRT